MAPAKKKPGRTRKKRRSKLLANPNPNSSPSTTDEQPISLGENPEAEPEAEPGADSSENSGYSQVAARILDNAEQPATEGEPGEQIEEKDKIDVLAEKFVSGLCSETQVRRYLPIPFNAAAVGLKQDCIRLEDWELEMWVPAIVACGERYGPELLKATDKPELVMLALAALASLAKIGLLWKREQKPEILPPKKPDGTVPDSSTTESAVLSVS